MFFEVSPRYPGLSEAIQTLNNLRLNFKLSDHYCNLDLELEEGNYVPKLDIISSQPRGGLMEGFALTSK
jgi:hypothetical protein